MNPQIHSLAIDALCKGIYKKNIHYMYKQGADPEEFSFVRALGASPGMSSWIIQQAHYKLGVQMQVSKSVTSDLMSSDFSEAAKVENVPWPAPVVELYFQDPMLPSILVMKTTPQQLQEWFPKLEIGLIAEEYITACMQEGSELETAMQLSLQLKPDMYSAFLASGETPSMKTGPLSIELSLQDNAVMAFMLHLSLKVFAFASIPAYKPVPMTRKQMVFGGKPEVKGRPTVPSFHVTYMPKVVYTKPSEPATNGTGHQFRGKRGHIHFYYHERFTNRQGTWDFYPPSINPLTGKFPEHSIIKVRKP